MKKKITKSKGEIDNYIIIVGNFNTQLSVVVRICYFSESTIWGGQSRGCDPYFTVQETEI